MFRKLIVTGVVLAAAGLFQTRVIADGSQVNGDAAPPPTRPLEGDRDLEATPAEMARDAFNEGIRRRDRARRFEEQAAKQEKDRDKNLATAKQEYTAALQFFQKAVQLDNRMHQGYNGLGFTYRKLGDYTSALQAYDTALRLSPKFSDAIEYRGEAYLGLNMTEDAKRAYLALLPLDRKQADMLLKAMAAWVTDRQASPKGIHPDVIAGLDTWIKERSTVAKITMAMSPTANRTMWQ